MELRVFTDDGEETRVVDDELPVRALLDALGEGQLFGAFALGATPSDHEALRRAQARSSRAFYATLDDHELANAVAIGHGTHERGTLVMTGDRVLVLSPTGRACEPRATLGGLLELAAQPEHAVWHLYESGLAGRPWFASAAAQPKPVPLVTDVAAHRKRMEEERRNDPNTKALELLLSLRKQPLVPPRVHDRRARRGTEGWLEALARSDEEADALLPILLEADEPLLALFDLRESLLARAPERTDYLRQIEKMGAHHGDRWKNIGSRAAASVPPDPILEIEQAGIGVAGPPQHVVPRGRADLAPVSIAGRLQAALAAWRTYDATFAADLERRLASFRASDLYFAWVALWLEKGHELANDDAWPALAVWRGDRSFGDAIDTIIAKSENEVLVPLLDLLLSRDPDDASFFEARHVPLLDARFRFAARTPIDVARVRAELAVWLAAPGTRTKLAKGWSLLLLARVDPLALAQLTEKHSKWIVEAMGAAELIEAIGPKSTCGKAAVAALMKLAASRELDTAEKLAAATAAKQLGAPGAADLVETLQKRLDAQLRNM